MDERGIWKSIGDKELIREARSRGLVLTKTVGAKTVELSALGEALCNEDAISQIREGIAGQFETAYSAYTAVLDSINSVNSTSSEKAPEPKKADIEEGLESQLDRWQEEGVFEYIRKRQEDVNGLEYLLLVQPASRISYYQFARSVNDFVALRNNGNDSSRLYVDKLYELYTPDELSGPATNQDIAFYLVPSQGVCDEPQTQPMQLAFLNQMQAEYPFLIAPPPALAPTYWHALRVKGLFEAGENIDSSDLSSMFHFDIRPRLVNSKPLNSHSVPHTYVVNSGRAYASSVQTHDVYRGREVIAPSW